MKFSPAVMHLFRTLKHAGQLPSGAEVLTAAIGDVNQGEMIQLAVHLQEGHIQAARFTCYGGVVSLAACEYLCAWLEGKALADLGSWHSQAFMAELSLTAIHVPIVARLQLLLKQLEEGGLGRS